MHELYSSFHIRLLATLAIIWATDSLGSSSSQSESSVIGAKPVNSVQSTGRWYYEAPTTDMATGEAQWMMGTYFEEYVRENDEWKFACIKTEWKYISPYDKGWAKDRGILLESLGG